MRELSLFTGAGGGLLGTRLMNWQCIGAVEIDKFCCEKVAQRRDEGHLGEWFPVWNMDIREFNQRVAPNYQGLIDVVSAGFPCQPFSVAGRQRAADDERNMWPATIECIRVVQPRFCFLENVPGLLRKSHGYFGTILRDLAESGYDVRWCVLSAAELGAPQRRNRLWIVASAKSELWHDRPNDSIWSRASTSETKTGKFRRQDFGVLPLGSDWNLYKPRISGTDDGVADRVDRSRALGNGQVPIVVRAAWELLTGELE